MLKLGGFKYAKDVHFNSGHHQPLKQISEQNNWFFFLVRYTS